MRWLHVSAEWQASASSSAGWRTSRPGRREVHRAAGVGRDDDQRGVRVTARGPERGDLAVADRVRRARARATEYAPPAPQQRPSSAVSTQPVRAARARCAPRRAPAARGGGGTGPARRRVAPVSRSRAAAALGDPLGEVDAPVPRTHAPRRRAEQAAVVLHRRAAARAVDDDRRVAGHRRDDPLRRAAAPSSTRPGVGVQRAAAVAAAPGQRRRARPWRASRASAARWMSRSHASITQPVNRYASRVPASAIERRAERARPRARAARSRARHEAEPLRDQRAPT